MVALGRLVLLVVMLGLRNGVVLVEAVIRLVRLRIRRAVSQFTAAAVGALARVLRLRPVLLLVRLAVLLGWPLRMRLLAAGAVLSAQTERLRLLVDPALLAMGRSAALVAVAVVALLQLTLLARLAGSVALWAVAVEEAVLGLIQVLVALVELVVGARFASMRGKNLQDD